MPETNAHLSDERLILFADGEVQGREEAKIREHLAACWSCRLRMREFDAAIAEVARMHRENTCQMLPALEGPRALLKARLREMAAATPRPWTVQGFGWVTPARGIGLLAATLVLGAVVWMAANPGERRAIPRHDLTPGAVRTVAVSDVCRVRLSDNGEVVPAVQRLVFAEYGMANAEARAYEVDYLITPALGGADDIRNLWPQPYYGSPWNAYVKDALEDRLRQMVCAGKLDLSTAQHEIATNWVAAYKKYFETDRPLEAHVRFRRAGHAE